MTCTQNCNQGRMCDCEHWQTCPTCYPQGFDAEGNRLPPQPTPLEAARKENEKLRMALENCRLFAARHRKEDWALLILGFCAEGGVVGSITR